MVHYIIQSWNVLPSCLPLNLCSSAAYPENLLCAQPCPWKENILKGWFDLTSLVIIWKIKLLSYRWLRDPGEACFSGFSTGFVTRSTSPCSGPEITTLAPLSKSLNLFDPVFPHLWKRLIWGYFFPWLLRI